jgi:hypothetical protein
MYRSLLALSIILVAVGMGLSLAHALEFPGKLRLPKQTYLAVQAMYYPGFTIGGVFGEFGAMLATFGLWLATPSESGSYWLVLMALLALVAMHAVFWIVVQPVNKIWLKDQQLTGADAAFFAAGGDLPSDRAWTAQRDRWEYGHVARAVLAMTALIALVAAAIA